MPRAHPNVILVVSDQLRAFELGCYGHPTIRTPNIDQLGRDGVRFEIACSNNPLCTPARACLVSGQYSRTCNGMIGNVGDPAPIRRRFPNVTMPEAFRAAGYDTAIIGTWHQEPRASLVGFDYSLIPSAIRTQHWRPTYRENDGEPFVHEGWAWDRQFETTRKYIADHASRASKPFFMQLSIDPPHMPLAEAPERFARMYSRDDVRLRPNTSIDGCLAHDDHWFKIYLWESRYVTDREPATLTLPDGFDLRDLYAKYYGMVSLVDEQVGRLLRILEEANLIEDTIVIFTADHGDQLGSHGCFNKGRLFEESIRVPLIYRWPGRLEPRTIDQQVASHIDAMPTLLTLAGIDIPDGIQGTDLSPVLRQHSRTAGRNVAFIECCHADRTDATTGAVGIRTRDHLYGIGLKNASLYAHNPADDEVINDELRCQDLVADPQQMERSSANALLRDLLMHWHQNTPWLNVRI